MSKKIVLLALILTALIVGCGTKWNALNPLPSYQKYGWETEYHAKISGYDLIVSVGHEGRLSKLEIFCSNDLYHRNWDKICVDFKNGQIVNFFFVCKVNGKFIAEEKEAQLWQKSPIRTLRQEEYLANLPSEIQEQVKKAIAYADRKYRFSYE